MNKKKDLEKPKTPPKITKAQGSVLPGRRSESSIMNYNPR
jgi:hypothetical protein